MAEGFVSRPFSVVLNAIRFCMALVVVEGHAVQLGAYEAGGNPLFAPAARHGAVIVFFVLSGLTVADSTRRHATLRDFAASRLTRILPVAYAALLLGSAIFWLGSGTTTFGFAHPARFASHDLRSALLPALFLSQSAYGTGPLWNPPYWSICYEVWYYVIFAMVHYLRGRARRLGIAAACVAAGPLILLLFPIWLAGMALARLDLPRLPVWLCWITAAASLVLACAIGAASDPLRAAVDEHMPGVVPYLGFSEFFVSDLLMALPVVALLVSLKQLAERHAGAVERFEQPAALLAGMSFTLYLMHWPLLVQARQWGLHADTALGLQGIVLGVIALCAALSVPLEFRRNRLRAAVAGAAERLRMVCVSSANRVRDPRR